MKTLSEIKNEVAKEMYSCTFLQSLNFLPEGHVIEMMDEVAKRYAEEALKEAAELCDDYEDRRGEHKVNILNLINELK